MKSCGRLDEQTLLKGGHARLRLVAAASARFKFCADKWSHKTARFSRAMSDFISNAEECAIALERAMLAMELDVFKGIFRLIADYAGPYYIREFTFSK